MAAAASAAGGAAGAAPRSRGSSLAARQQAVYMNPNSACTLGPLPTGAKNAANALSDERPTRLTENLRICYSHLTAKSDQYGSRSTAETQLVQVKEGVKDPQIIGAFSGIFNLLEGFDTSMIEDKSFIPALKKYRRLRVAGILQAMLLGEVELSDQSVYTAAIVICEAMPREPELHCEPTRNALIDMTLSTAVSPSLVPRGGNWLYEMAKVDSRWQTFFQVANKNVIRAMQAAVVKGRRDLPSNVQPAGAEEAFKAWAYQRPTALCTPPKAVVGYMKAIYCISADALAKMQTVNAHAFEVGSMCKEIEAVWSSYDDFVDFFTEEIGIAPTIFHLIDWKRAKPLTMPSKEIGDWHAGDPVLERGGYLVFPMQHCTELNAASMHERWVHGTQFSSLWNILGHGNAVASLGDAEALTGVRTSTKPVCLESFYSCLSHIGLGVTVRLALLLRPLGKNAHEAYKHTEKGPVHQRVIRQFRVRVEAIALKEETIGEGTSAVAGNLLSHNPATHLWNPVLEVNPHSAEVGWIRHGANRVALTVGVEIPAGSVAREASVPPAKPGGEVDFKFFPQEVRDFGEVRCCPLFETWENYVPASEGKFFPLAGGLPLSGAAKLMYHAPEHAVAQLANAATRCSEFMSAISGNIYPDRQDNQPCELVREMWESWAFNVRAHVISMIWPVTVMEYAGCEQPDNLGFVLTMLGYVNPSATAGLCAELLSGCKPNKISYIGVEGSRVVVLVGPSHRVTGSAGQSITEAKLQEQWTTIRTKLPAKTGEYALEVVEVEEETSVAELLRTVVSQKLADPVHAGAPAGAKDDIFIIFTKCLWLTEWRKSENTYGPSPDAGRVIDENIDAMKAFANKGGRSQAPTIILSGPGIVWHGTAMQEVATSFS